MNDELSGQLTAASWRIPEYARSALWIETDSDSVQTEGERGLFELNTPAQELVVRYGHEAGPALALLRWQPDSLEWDGTVRVGGFVDALHLAEYPGLGAVGILHLGGQPLKPDVSMEHSGAQRLNAHTYEPPDFFAGAADELTETTTTWLIGDDSPLLTLAQDALMNKLRVWFSGRLAAHKSGWDKHFALPLLLESVMLFTP